MWARAAVTAVGSFEGGGTCGSFGRRRHVRAEGGEDEAAPMVSLPSCLDKKDEARRGGGDGGNTMTVSARGRTPVMYSEPGVWCSGGEASDK